MDEEFNIGIWMSVSQSVSEGQGLILARLGPGKKWVLGLPETDVLEQNLFSNYGFYMYLVHNQLLSQI